MKIKSLSDMRTALLEDIQNTRDKKMDAKDLNAIKGAFDTVVRTVKLELEFAKLSNIKPRSDFMQLEEPITLGAETGTTATP